jgi:hypothetical protein
MLLVIGGSQLAACDGEPTSKNVSSGEIQSSGKLAAALPDLPPAVIAAALAARPDLKVSEAEYETRDGREYYDVGGTLADGSELELDMTLVDGLWTVVEIQRDIDGSQLPAAVADALAESVPGWVPTRIIESDQGDGTVIYEFFGTGPGGDTVKHEIKWADATAELLSEEWAH